MTREDLVLDLERSLAELPMFDVHTHLVGGRLGARGLHDILLYHMVVSDLYAAGCPSGARLTQYPGWPGQAEAHARIEEALPYLPSIRNTSCAWMMRIILADLYGWNEPITAENWRRLDGMIRERADDRAWHHSIFDRLNIRRTCAEHARRGNGEDDGRLQYRSNAFSRCQWGEFDMACMSWNAGGGSLLPRRSPRKASTDRTIRSLVMSPARRAPAFYDALLSGYHHDRHHPPRQRHRSPLVDEGGTRCSVLAAACKRGRAERYLLLLHQRSLLDRLEKWPDRLQFSSGAGLSTRQASIPHQDDPAACRNVRPPSGSHFRASLRGTTRRFARWPASCRTWSPLGYYWWHNFYPRPFARSFHARHAAPLKADRGSSPWPVEGLRQARGWCRNKSPACSPRRSSKS